MIYSQFIASGLVFCGNLANFVGKTKRFFITTMEYDFDSLRREVTDEGAMKVLVADNMPGRGQHLKLALMRGGYTMSMAVGVEACIDKARRERPDVVLANARMTDAEGRGVAQMLKGEAETWHTSVILIDEEDKPANVQKGLLEGADDILSSPPLIGEFGLKVKQAAQLAKLRRAFAGEQRRTAVKGRILVVDDVKTSMLVHKVLLTHVGHEVMTGCNGEECIEKALKEHPDFILLDVLMPGINGFQTTVRLKTSPETRDIPIMLLTALCSSADRKMGFDSGADDYMVKPFNKEELFARVNRMLERQYYMKKLFDV